jgi:putative FmdB family regulatory protein
MLLTIIESKVKVAHWARSEVIAHTSNDGGGLYSAFSGGELRPFAALRPRAMPTYDYSCEKCGKTFETFQSMRDEPFRECPEELCRQKKWGHGKVKRLLGTGAGLIFKGSGFYITDYRSNSYKEGAKSDAPAAPAVSGEKSAGAKESGGAATASTPAKGREAKPKEQSTK